MYYAVTTHNQYCTACLDAALQCNKRRYQEPKTKATQPHLHGSIVLELGDRLARLTGVEQAHGVVVRAGEPQVGVARVLREGANEIGVVARHLHYKSNIKRDSTS